MENSKEEKLVHAPDSKIRERFFGPKQTVKPMPGYTTTRPRSKSTSRNNPDDPVPAEKFTSCSLDEAVKLQLSDKGAGSQKPVTVMTAFQMTLDRYSDNDAFAVNVNGKWKKTKLRDMYRTVRTVAKGFLRLGLTRFHGVGIIGYNSPEWIISCLAAIFAGGVAVGIHYDHTVEDCKRAALLVQCNIIVVDSAEDLAKIIQIRYNLPDLVAIVQYGKDKGQKAHGVMSWEQLLETGEQAPEDLLKESIMSQAPNYCCTITFTMGRTGTPKPVMLSHDNVVWTARVFGKYQSFSNTGGAHVSFSPLSQPVGQLLDIFIPLMYATTVYFVPRELRKHKLIDVLRDAHPTFFIIVPYFYQKLAERLELSFDKNIFSRLIARMAMNIGRKAIINAKEGKSRPFGWWWANRFVYKKIQRRLGFDRCVEVHTAGNFMQQRVAEFFARLNTVILTDYGTSELTGPHAISLPDRYRLGSVGVEMDGCRTKFVPYEKTVFNEMRVKGRHVFMGYLNEEQLTADAFDDDGWYKTRDMGNRDESGFLWFVGSIHELYELSDGRVLSPVPIEMAVKEQLPFLGHAVAVGHQRPYLVMLFTFQAATDMATDMPLDVLSKYAEMWFRRMNVKVSKISEMANNLPEKLVSKIQSVVDEVNKTNLDFTNGIQKWQFLPQDFSIPTGELNPSRREKRKFILDLYAPIIESLYASE